VERFSSKAPLRAEGAISTRCPKCGASFEVKVEESAVAFTVVNFDETWGLNALVVKCPECKREINVGRPYAIQRPPS